MSTNARDRSNQSPLLSPTTIDLIDIMAERNRRSGRGPTKRADVVRDAVRNLFEMDSKAPSR